MQTTKTDFVVVRTNNQIAEKNQIFSNYFDFNIFAKQNILDRLAETIDLTRLLP